MAALVRPALLPRGAHPLNLRPIFLSMPSQLCLCSRQHRLLTTTSTSSSSASSPIPEPPTLASESSTNQDQQAIPNFEPLTYHVHRTPSQQLPIYHLAKAGGNKHQTRIRKISGSVEDLKDDLRKALDLGEKDIVINNVNKHIVIKGWKKFEVAKFLEGKRF